MADQKPTETWKDIADFPGYAISNHGCVKRTAEGQGTKPGPIVSAPNANGYHIVSLRKDGKTHSSYVHDLVGRHFVKGWTKGMTVQHVDHNRNNNVAANLSWATKSDNSGEGRISAKKLHAIRVLAKKGWASTKIAAALKLTPGAVNLALQRK